MRLGHISLGNLRRRKGKAAFLIAGLSIGVAVVVAMVGITTRMKADVERKLDEFGANIIVTPRSESLSLSYGGVSVTDASIEVQELGAGDAALIKTIKNSRNISAVAPKVIGTKEIGGYSALLVGVDFPTEFMIKKWWKINGAKAEGPDEVVLGSRAASGLGLGPGDSVVIDATVYKVAGVLEENVSQDDVAVFMDIGEARRALGKEGKTSLIEVSALCSDCPIDDIVAQISAKLPHAKVSPVRQAIALKMETVGQITRFSAAVSVVVLIIGSFIVFVSMMSSVNERTKEIGVLRAIGYRRSHILTTILIEAFVVSLISGLLGWAGGSLSTAVLAPENMLLGAFGGFEPVMLLMSILIALTVGMLSSLYPAMKAARLEPLEALRYI